MSSNEMIMFTNQEPLDAHFRLINLVRKVFLTFIFLSKFNFRNFYGFVSARSLQQIILQILECFVRKNETEKKLEMSS